MRPFLLTSELLEYLRTCLNIINAENVPDVTSSHESLNSLGEKKIREYDEKCFFIHIRRIGMSIMDYASLYRQEISKRCAEEYVETERHRYTTLPAPPNPLLSPPCFPPHLLYSQTGHQKKKGEKTSEPSLRRELMNTSLMGNKQ